MSADRVLLLSLIERLYADGVLSREAIEGIAADLTGDTESEVLAMNVRLLPDMGEMVRRTADAPADRRRREMVARTRMIERKMREGDGGEKA